MQELVKAVELLMEYTAEKMQPCDWNLLNWYQREIGRNQCQRLTDFIKNQTLFIFTGLATQVMDDPKELTSLKQTGQPR